MRHFRVGVTVRTVFILFVIFVCVFYLFIPSTSPGDQRARQLEIESLIKTEDNNLACKQPLLPVDSPEMLAFVENISKISCSEKGPDWVTCRQSECVIKESIRNAYGDVTCKFTDVIRKGDHGFRFSSSTVETDYKYGLVNSDVVKIDCTAGDQSWSSIKTGIRLDKATWERSGWQHVPENGLKLNVLMFGLDSISRNTFVRKLPKSYEYLVNNLGADVLEGYNIVGDGTPQALTPILTGHTELELPDVRKRFRNTEYVDVYPFVWKDFRSSGYVTAYLEDLPHQGIYTYRLNGFSHVPTDHYMRTYYLASNEYHKIWSRLCDGEIPRHKIMLNYIKDFFAVYKTKPKFLFGFHGELSHDDYNLVGAADEDIKEFLMDLNDNNVLNNTLLIVMADHGHRFAAIRNTMQGKLEERLPFFSFRFPPWFKASRRALYDNFISNLNILTTPFDIHATLMDIVRKTSPAQGNLKSRSISLFSKIPKDRSCATAYIEPHWCACLDWHTINAEDPIVKKLKHTFLEVINSYTSTNRDICAALDIAEIKWVTKLKPKEQLLKFKKNADYDGFVADMSDSTKVTIAMYQIKVRTTPGDGVFEASITHFLESDELEMKMSDVSRINMYGNQARCVEDRYPHLRKYCYCTTD